MKNEPEIKIIGGASAEKKEETKMEIRQILFDHFESLSPQEQKQLKKLEYPKSEKEVALINFANKETNLLMQEADVKPYDVPIENYHIIPPELFKEAVDDSATAATFSTKQGMLFDARCFRDNPVRFGAVVFHETLHLKAHFSMQVEEEKEGLNKTPYREGVTVNASQKFSDHGKYHRHFLGLHEAIVAEAEKKFLRKLLNEPKLAEEKKWLESDEAKELKQKLAAKKEISEDDIVWVGQKEANDWEAVSYLPQRNALNFVCLEIQKEFHDQYQNADDVFKVFLNAHFTGKLLPIAQLVEKTFGQGSFRLLGNMNTDKESGVLHLESLKKNRARQKKARALSSM